MYRNVYTYLTIVCLMLCGRCCQAQLIVAQRTGGVAPLGLHFTVNETDWSLLKGSDYEWVFPGGDTVIGFQALHTFLASGPVLLKITRADHSTYTETLDIAVQVPDDAYAAGRTTCISSSGDFTGCPAGALQVTASGLAGITFPAGRRCLFRGGETFDLSGSKTLYAGSYISSYGGGKATIRVSGDATTTTFWMQDSITVAQVAFEGSEWVQSPAWGSTLYGEGRLFAPENHTTLYDLEVRNMTAFAIMDDGIGPRTNLVIDSVDAWNLGSYFLYAGPSPSIQCSGVQRSRIRNIMANHGIRLNGGRFFTASRLHVDSVERAHITYRGLRYGMVSDSRFTGKGFYKNSIRNISDDASTLDTVRYIIFERNRYESRLNEFGLDFNIGSDIVVRNNLLLNSSFNIGVNLSGVIPQRVEVLHNTFYQDNYDWYPAIILRPHSTGVFRGNIAYADNCSGACITENPFSSGSNQNPVLWQIDHNAYYVSGDPAGNQFRPGMSFAAWQGLGFDAGGTYGTLGFVEKTPVLADADFTPLTGGMLDLAPFYTHRDLYGRRRSATALHDAGAVENGLITSIESIPAGDVLLEVYPNPARDWLRITIPPGGRLLILTDRLGRERRRIQATSMALPLSLAGLEPGLYHLRVVDPMGKAYRASFIRW